MIRGRARFVLTAAQPGRAWRPVTAALDLRDLHFAYGKGGAVRGVSLRLMPGDCYGFLGHNGAGKTTVLRLALGLLRPQRGEVHVFGIDARRDPVAARARIGALVERPGFHLHTSARENLRGLARLQGLPHRLAAAESERVLERTGLAGVADRAVGTFSLGMRQRLGIAQALLGQPPLLLLDEPTNGLDPEGIADLRTLLQQLVHDDGTTVLVSSHQLAELDGLCTRIGVLQNGAMVVEGELDRLRSQVAPAHRIAGAPIAALRQRLQQRGLSPRDDGSELLVELGDQPPAAVLRDLIATADVSAFAQAPVTLESIYRRAASLHGSPAVPAQNAPPATAPNTAPPPSRAPRMGNTSWPLRRAMAQELRTLRHQRSNWLVLLLPAAVGVYGVFAANRQVQHALARVERGELFSADAGSGYVAMAQALQAAMPVLALCLLWLASQSLSADLAGDTLRNTLVRSVQRRHVLVAKLAALAAVAAIAGTTMLIATAIAAQTLLGFVDLEEVSRHGDRQLLAAAADARPALMMAIRSLAAPLLAVLSLGLCASAISRRPARALLLALLAVLGPELLRDRLRDHAGWLLTSHLPTGLRDDSGVGWAAALARGAGDALWRWQELAWWTPLAWAGAAFAIAALLVRRLRVP